MTFLTQLLIDLRVRVNALFRRSALRQRLDEELRFHLDMREEKLIEEGVPPAEARWRAERAFGNVSMTRELASDMWRYGAVERLFQDIRYGMRALARTPGFTAVAVISLALGIGANAAIFTLIDRVVLRLLPVKDPQELVIVPGVQSYPLYEIYRDRTTDVFAGVLGFVSLSQIVVDDRVDAALAEGRLVSGNYFDVLRIQPAIGRLISDDDDRVPGESAVVVISHAFWSQYYNADPNVIGRVIRLGPGLVSSGTATGGFEAPAATSLPPGGDRFTIIGVAPASFAAETVGNRPDFWAPLAAQERFMPGRLWLERKSARWVRVMARLQPGVTRERARSALNVVYQQAIPEAFDFNSAEEQKTLAQQKLDLLEGDKGFSTALRGQFAQPLTVLMVMVAVVLLIASANLANLLLARAAARRRETGVRLALGAGRSRLIRQLLTESLLLAFLGGAAALLVAWWGSATMFAMAAERGSALRLDLSPDWRMFAFTAAVSIVTALIFGLGPALRGTRIDVSASLKETGRAAGRGSWNTGRLLVAGQVALSVVLLIGTGLFTRTLYKMKAQDLGYKPDNVILMRVDPIGAGYHGDDIGRVCQALLERIRTLPGVQAATFSENGLFKPAAADDMIVRFDQVGPGYFTHVGIPILLGRDLAESDNAASERVVVINEKMAKFYFATSNPVGRQIDYQAGSDRFTLTIVGVARDARDHGLREEVYRRMYVSFMQPIDGLTGANTRCELQSSRR
jgi:MacB-like periplasmic core domain/FtsX-like permease family